MMTCVLHFSFIKQKTVYEMRISDWSSDVSSSDEDTIRHDVPALDHHGLARPHAAVAHGFARYRLAPCGRDLRARARRHENAPRRDGLRPPAFGRSPDQIGRASCRERVGQYVLIQVGGVSIKNKNKKQNK